MSVAVEEAKEPKTGWSEVSHRLNEISKKYESRPKILLVEDRRDDQASTIRYYLAAKGFEVETVYLMSEFLDSVKSGKFDCIIVGVETEESIDTIAYLREESETKIIGLVDNYSETVESAYDMVITKKNLDLPDLSLAVNNAMRLSHAEHRSKTS